MLSRDESICRQRLQRRHPRAAARGREAALRTGLIDEQNDVLAAFGAEERAGIRTRWRMDSFVVATRELAGGQSCERAGLTRRERFDLHRQSRAALRELGKRGLTDDHGKRDAGNEQHDATACDCDFQQRGPGAPQRTSGDDGGDSTGEDDEAQVDRGRRRNVLVSALRVSPEPHQRLSEQIPADELADARQRDQLREMNESQRDAHDHDDCALRPARQQANQQRHGRRDERQIEEEVGGIKVQPLDQCESRGRQATREAARRKVTVGRVHERVLHEHAQNTDGLESSHVAEDPDGTVPGLQSLVPANTHARLPTHTRARNAVTL